MKNLTSMAVYLVAPLILGFPCLANAQMDIQVVDIGGALIPGDAGDCLPGATVESGSLKVMSKFSEDKNGGTHIVFHENLINVLVVDADGNYYRAAGTTNVAPGHPGFSNLNLPSGGSASLHLSLNNLIVPIGNPDLPKYSLHVLVQVTVNANGDIVTEVENVRSECFN